jgi:hypothetical protein
MMITVTLTLCVVLVTGLVLRRELSPPGSADGATAQELVAVDGWEALIQAGNRIGSPTPSVEVLVFVDFQCPACRTFAQGPLSTILDRFGEKLVVIVRHMPLPYHEYSYAAAIATECASAVAWPSVDMGGQKEKHETPTHREVKEVPHASSGHGGPRSNQGRW